jgi:4-amino-4-deoxy-L-arabinose transferase-like glycosyltransferase
VDARPTIDGALLRCASRPGLALLALLSLCLAVYLPGVIRLPAVDRTEVVYAETTRDMVARGAIADPRYGEAVHQFRPIGTYWAQAKFAWLAGVDHARDITVYRLPGMIAVTLSVLALYWLAAPLIGSMAAMIAAALFAVAPLTVLVAHLAIAEGLSLLPATVAMLALLRIYTAQPEQETRWLALLFWAALGFSVLINALLVPVLVVATLIALWIMDRDAVWLRRVHA